MFWTNWVRGVSKLLMALLIIASVVGGLILCYATTFFIGFIVIVLGVLISINTISMVMMMSEISTNIYALRVLLSKNKSGFTTENLNLSAETNQSVSDIQPKVYSNNTEQWICNCGTRNAGTSKYCKNCGKSRTPFSTSVKVKPNDSWVCKCGKRNPNSAEFCESCKRRKESHL